MTFYCLSFTGVGNMKEELYSNTMSRGDLGRKIYGNETCWKFNTIEEPITEWMRRVQGAELISEERGPFGDSYRATYFISPEGACIHIGALIALKISLFGATKEALQKTREKMSKALEEKPLEQRV